MRGAESDVPPDNGVARSRKTGGRDGHVHNDAASTTGTGRNQEFVGRVAGSDMGAEEVTGAEARTSRLRREDYQRGLPGYHDPTAGFGGAAPARSALTLRAWLAGLGVLCCLVLGVLLAVAGFVLFAVLAGVVAATALVNLLWVLHRKRRGEPG